MDQSNSDLKIEAKTLEEKGNLMKNYTELDEKEKSSSEGISRDTDNLSEIDCKSEFEADLMNHTKANHNDNSELGSSRWTTTMVDGEDGLAPAYRELIRELEEHRQHFKVDQARF